MLVIWDYDGVVVDSFASVRDVWERVGRSIGFAVPADLAAFRREYGNSSRDLLSAVGCDPTRIVEAQRLALVEYAQEGPPILPGIGDVLAEVGAEQVLVTTSPRDTVERRLGAESLLAHFDTIVAAEPGKPVDKAASFAALRERCGAARTIVVADRNSDYEAALRAGIPAANVLLVSYGWGFDEAATPGRTHAPIRSVADLGRELAMRATQA